MAIRQKFWQTVAVDRVWRTYPGETREVLTPAGNQFLAETGQFPPRDDEARADAANVSTADGLRMTEFINDAGGKVREFVNTGDRKVWLDRFKAVPQEQVMINRHCLPRDQFPIIEKKWREERATREQAARDIASGIDVRFDIETGERVS